MSINSEGELKRLADTAVDQFGGLDIARNATGWGLLKPLLATTKGGHRGNCCAPVNRRDPVLSSSAAGDAGCRLLVQISSATASIMLDDHAAYMGTKPATDHVIRCLANEFGLTPWGLASKTNCPVGCPASRRN